MPPQQPRFSITRDLILLTVFLTLLFGAFLGSRPFMTPDEGRYAEIPREMVESGDYLTPHLNYVKYFEKPPFIYWLEAATIKTAGLNEWALRGSIAILSLLGCLMVYLGGLKLYGRSSGILACLILATCALYFSMAHFVIPDTPLTVWLTGCLLLFLVGTRTPPEQGRRYYFWGMFACAALATLTKGLIGAVLPGLIIFVWLTMTNQWRQLKTYYLFSGILVFLLIAAPWHILVQLQNPEFFHFYFIEQHFMRYLTDYAGREQPYWFFPLVTMVGFFPWIVFPAAALNRLLAFRQLWRRQQTPDQTLTFLVVWALVIFIFFSLSKSQLLSYALPIMPPLALLSARFFATYWQEKRHPIISRGFIYLLILTLISGGVGIFITQDKITPGPLLPIYLAIGLWFLVGIASTICYWYGGVRAGVIALIITTSACLISLNVNYVNFDTRSIKPLALLLQPQLHADDVVVSYHEYYQDLPVYLQRRVMVVGYLGELEFGVRHQDTHDWIVGDATLWQRWLNGARMFMIMRQSEYQKLKTMRPEPPLYLIAQTTRNVLVTNKPQ